MANYYYHQHTYSTIPSTTPNRLNTIDNSAKDLSLILRERSCNTPEYMINRHGNDFLDKQFWSAKQRPVTPVEPSKRQLNFLNQTQISARGYHNKENIFTASHRRYKTYLMNCDELDENFDEEKNGFEDSKKSSIYNKSNSDNGSQYNCQMEDSFYKRFSEIKGHTTLPTLKEFELDEERSLRSSEVAKSNGALHRQETQPNQAKDTSFQKHDKKPLVAMRQKRPPVLPYQTLTHQAAKAEIYKNRMKKMNMGGAAEANKENRNVNVDHKPQRTMYDELLKKYLATKKDNTKTITPLKPTSAKAQNTSLTSRSKAAKAPNRPTSGKENTSINNRTLSIGNRETLRMLDLPKQPRDTFVIHESPLETDRLIPTTRKEGKEIPWEHLKARKPSIGKFTLNPTCLKTLTDRSFSNPRLKIHKINTIEEPPKIKPAFVKPPQTLKDLRFDKVLGQGAYAVVKLAQDKLGGRQVAVKTYEKSKLTDPARMKNVRREIALLKGLDHPNIIKLHSSFETPKQIHLIMEYTGKSSLQSYLKSKTLRRLDESEVKILFRQLCQGISYCHKKHIVHRDIKLENILLGDNSHDVKVIDFGFSISVPQDRRLAIFCGTPSYMAPEIVSKFPYRGAPSDVWALGIVLYALLCGRFPFRGFDERDLFSKIRKGKFDLPTHLSQGAGRLLQKILRVRPEDRLTVDEILEDSWLKD